MTRREPAPLVDVVGRNAHRIRLNAGLTLDQVAVAARARGLKWSESRVADFESGRVATNLATMIAFALAIEDLGCGSGTLHELVQDLQPIRLNESLAIWPGDMIRLFEGRPADNPRASRLSKARDRNHPVPSVFSDEYEQRIAHYYLDRTVPGLLHRVNASTGATEVRVCKSLGISTMLLTHLTVALWRASFSQERDKRAGPEASPQARGQVSRQMRSELSAAIEVAVLSGNNQ